MSALPDRTKSKNLITTPEVDWSALPTGILELISKILLLNFDPDYVRFRSVCNSWRSAAPKRPNLPWLIGEDDLEHTTFRFCKLISSLEDGDHHQIVPITHRLPPPASTHSAAGGGMLLRCIRSTHGWMALMDDTSQFISLFNPITKSTIHLPTPLLCPYTTDCEPSRLILSSNPAASPSQYMALILCSCCRYFIFCRPGEEDDSWTPLLDTGFQCTAAEAAFYKGRFYAVDCCEVYVCDLGPGLRVWHVASVRPEEYSDLPDIDECHLVESGGDLLLVLAYYRSGATYEGYWYKIFRVECGVEVKLVKVEDLGGRALFVSQNSSFSLCASRIPGCKENSIYYTWNFYNLDKNYRSKLRVCNLMDGSDVFIGDDAALSDEDWKPTAWFTPSLLSSEL